MHAQASAATLTQTRRTANICRNCLAGNYLRLEILVTHRNGVNGPFMIFLLSQVEMTGIEPVASGLQNRRSPS